MSFLQNLSDVFYCLETGLAMLLFWLPLEKRKLPFLRLMAGVPLLAAEALWIGPWLRGQGIRIWFFVVYATLLCMCLFSARIALREALLCLSCAYLMQHFTSSIYLFLFQTGQISADGLFLKWFYPALFLGVYTLFYFLFARGMTESGHYPVSLGFSVFIAVITIAVVYYLSIFTKELAHFMHVDTQADSYQIMLGICQVYAMFVCFLTLFLLKLYRNEIHAWKTLESNKAIWNQRKQQYEFSKENMELLSHRFHDMKHYLAALSQTGGPESRKDRYVQELEKMMLAYGNYAQTGNEALDAILTEKGLYCSNHDIRWTCVADGSFLGFIDVVDLYTMMGNALDNAVESVEKTDHPELRFISVNIRREREFALIRIKNHMEEKPRFQENLPITSKSDAEHHGFGMKSIRSIAEKYHGSMTVTAENHVFTLNILIPLA